MIALIFLSSFIFPKSGTIAQPITSANTKGVSYSDVGRLRDAWAIQRDIIQTARIEASYWLTGMQEVSRSQTEPFVVGLLSLLESDPLKQPVSEYFVREFPGKNKDKPWRELVFTKDGRNVREKFERGEKSVRNDYVTQETVYDGEHEAMYWSDSGQVNIYAGNSPWHRMSISSFVSVPDERVLKLPVSYIEGNRAKFSDDKSAYVIDLKSGNLLQRDLDNSTSYQLAFQEYDGVSLPMAILRVSYRKEMLYRLSVLLIKRADFNVPIADEFRLSVPGGTLVADMRPDGENKTYRTKTPIDDSVAWLDQVRSTTVALQPAASSDSKSGILLAFNVAIILIIVGVMLIKWRKVGV